MKIKIAAIVMALTAAASMRFGQTAHTETDAQTGTVKATDTAQVSFSAETNMTDTEVETETDAPKFTVELELVPESVTEHEIKPETTAPTETERAEETTGPAESEAEPEPPKSTLSVTFEVSVGSEKETDAETTAHVTETETTVPVTETETAPPETTSSSTTAESSSTSDEAEAVPDTMHETEPIPETEFNIDYWISFARDYAQSVGLNLDKTAVGCWDDPITASAKSAYLERDIKNRINRYAKDGSIFDVWIWAEANADGSFDIYIGYA